MEKQLEIVNDTLNNFPWLTDQEKWSEEDYRATPFETLTTFGRDCEDMTIGKFWLTSDDGAKKSVLPVVSGRHLGKLEKVKARMLETQETYQKYNSGRRLLPGDS